MSWIETVRNKPHQEKLKIIWIITGVACAFLILLWIILGNPTRKASPDTTIFQTLNSSLKNTFKQFKEMPKAN